MSEPGTRSKGPLLTLVVGLALAVTVLVTSMVVKSASDDRASDAGTGAAPSSSATPTPKSDQGIGAPVVPTAKTTFAGRTRTDPAAMIAVVTNNGKAVAYLCDGKVESWLVGTVEPTGEIALKSKKGATLTATVAGTQLSGTVTAAGRKWQFAVKMVTKPGSLYRATADVRGAAVVGGWIVLPDGSQVGVVTVDDVPQPAPAIDPATGAVTVDGAALTAEPVTGALTPN
jgi:hypothetical protein